AVEITNQNHRLAATQDAYVAMENTSNPLLCFFPCWRWNWLHRGGLHSFDRCGLNCDWLLDGAISVVTPAEQHTNCCTDQDAQIDTRKYVHSNFHPDAPIAACRACNTRTGASPFLQRKKVGMVFATPTSSFTGHSGRQSGCSSGWWKDFDSC